MERNIDTIKFQHRHNKLSWISNSSSKQIAVQENHNIHTFFILFSCFSWGKFKATLVTSNGQKPGLSVFSFFSREQKF